MHNKRPSNALDVTVPHLVIVKLTVLWHTSVLDEPIDRFFEFGASHQTRTILSRGYTHPSCMISILLMISWSGSSMLPDPMRKKIADHGNI
eukprot:scaffold292946_cov15-Prasinocladus_malaysianus.AAC.1